jgi:exosortase
VSTATAIKPVDATGTSATPPPSGERASRATLLLVLAGLLAVFAPTLMWLWERWTMSVWQNAHGLLLVPVVGYFIRDELTALRHLPRSSNAWGFLFLLPALALHALDAGIHTELLGAGALVMALPGLALLFLGTTRAKAIAVPLLFLGLALPIPLSFTEQIHLALRHMVTDATAWVVPMFGVPVFVEGTTLNTAHGALEVADACSGFSTLYAAVAVAILTAYQAASPARRVLVLLGAAPIAIAANVLRVVVLVLLVVWQGGEILETFVHPLSGIMTFVLALPLIFWLGGEQRGLAPSQTPVAPPPTPAT